MIDYLTRDTTAGLYLTSLVVPGVFELVKAMTSAGVNV